MTQDEFIRRRKERQRRIRKRRLFISLIFFIVALIATGVILTFTVFFPVEEITIEGSNKYTAEQIEAASGIDIGDNIFVISKRGTLKQLKNKLPYIENIKIKRNLSGKLKITVTNAKEYVSFKCDDGYYTVSENDWVLKKTKKAPKNVCTVYGADVTCKVGQSTVYNSKNLKELYRKITDELAANDLKINSIDVRNTVAINLKIEDRFEVSLGNANFLKEKIKHLSRMNSEIDPKKQGNINLNMWTNTKQEGTFVEKKGKN